MSRSINDRRVRTVMAAIDRAIASPLPLSSGVLDEALGILVSMKNFEREVAEEAAQQGAA